MKLSSLLAEVPYIISAFPNNDPEINSGVSEDSRTIQPGGLFVARSGGSFDGHEFITSAIARGAAAVVGDLPAEKIKTSVPYIQVNDSGLALAYLSAAWEGFPSRKLVMIGVTGTDGKTTTCNLINSILKSAGVRVGMISTINADLGDEELETGLHVTTPTAPETQAFLRRMVDAGMTHCILETTSHAWVQHRVAACDFDVAVITNITHEHLDFHRTWENYRDAKAMLFLSLMAGRRKPGVPKIAVINDDDGSADFLNKIPADERIGFSTNSRSGSDVLTTLVSYDTNRTRLEITAKGVDMHVSTPLVGEFNVSNILAAIGVSVGLNISPHAIVKGISELKVVSGRMERVDEGQGFVAIVDFAHTPNALASALRAARQIIAPPGRVIVVFGSAGLRDPQKRRLMGFEAAALADFTFITAEDPRTESLDDIMKTTADAITEKGGIEGQTFWRVPDRGDAIFKAVKLANAGDVVIACGKGHEQSMCFGTTEYPWDDRDAMRNALRGAPLKTLPTAGDV